MPLAMVIGVAVRVLHHNNNSLAPNGHLGICVHDTQTMRQAGFITPFQALHHHVHVATQTHGLCPGMYEPHSSQFGPGGLVNSHFTCNGKFCLMACQQV